MNRRRLLRLILPMATGLILLIILLAFTSWRSPPFYTEFTPRPLVTPIMTTVRYAEIADTHPQPVVVEIDGADGAVLLYGAEHTKDPADPQIADIRRRWQSFEPTVALIEGRLGFLIPVLMNPVRSYGEMGEVNALARDDRIPVYSWELSREVEIARMLEAFPAQRVALYYVLRPYFGNLRHGKPEDPDAYVEEYRRARTGYPGLENTLVSVEQIDSIWQRDFAAHPDWRDTSDEYGLPGYLGAIAARSNAIRDEHLARVIVDLVGKGDRVFAAAGSSHAVRLEGALRATLRTRGQPR